MTVSAGKGRLKLLFFSQRFLYPMDTGGKIRTGKILEKLKDIFDITLVSNVESPKDDAYLDQVRKLCAEFYPVPWKEERKYSFRFYLKLFQTMFSRYPFTVISDHSKDLEAALCELTTSKRFDLLVCDFLQSTLNFRNLKGIPTLLFTHNIESIIPRRYFETSRNPIARVFWWLQWLKMRRYEKEACAKFDGVVTVSDNDKDILEQEFNAKNVVTIPTGVDVEYFAPREEPVKENSLVFTGSMDWLPNEDAILFFVREILGKIKQAIPTVKLTVVGRNPSRHLIRELKNYPEVNVVGRVEDVRPFIGSHAVYIIPLRVGGGTRIKAYEAMAMGKAVVSTRVGVEGLPVRDAEHVILADEPDEFADAVKKLLESTEQRNQIERNARSFVETDFSWRKVADVFADICRKVAAGTCEDRRLPALGEVGNARSLDGATCDRFIRRW
jgi:polysaccharide biosynthesis protein PslH